MSDNEQCPIDCGDNSCVCAGPVRGGMRTNGGCRCERHELRMAVQWWRQHAENTRTGDLYQAARKEVAGLLYRRKTHAKWREGIIDACMAIDRACHPQFVAKGEEK